MTDIQHNWPVFGHDWAVDYLRKGMLNDRLRQAYLVTGVRSIGKSQFAHAFAMALNCHQADITRRPCLECRSCKLTMSGNHPDLIYSERDSNSSVLKIDSLRRVMHQIALKPFESRYRIALIPDFEMAQPRAQDTILKTLEEPPPRAVIILMAESTEQLLSTIISRCQSVHLRPIPFAILRDVLVDLFNAEGEQAELLARLSSGRIGWAIDALNNPETLEQRDEALDQLDAILKEGRAGRFKAADEMSKDRDKGMLALRLELWQSYWRDALLIAEGSSILPNNSDRRVQLEQLLYGTDGEGALRALRATQKMMDVLKTNANIRQALEIMFLDYPGL